MSECNCTLHYNQHPRMLEIHSSYFHTSSFTTVLQNSQAPAQISQEKCTVLQVLVDETEKGTHYL